jgi:glycerol-3-phosphate O-acyltransferase / dihydroxyacetone phosphate acyltransferase
VRALTGEIDRHLRAVVPDFEDPIEWAAADLAAEVALRSSRSQEPALRDRATLAAAIGRAPEAIRREALDALARYELELRLGNLDDRLVGTPTRLRDAVRPLVAVAVVVGLLAPWALFGLLANAVPAALVLTSGLVVRVPVTKGTVRVLVALVAFPLTWTVIAVAMAEAWLTRAGVLLACMLAGFLALAAVEAAFRLVEHLVEWRRVRERRQPLDALRARRAAVVLSVRRAAGAESTLR